MKLKNTFIQGKMSKDVDERLVENGQYIHAENIRVINSEGSDVGAIENCKGNTQQTYLSLGANLRTLRAIPHETTNKIYFFNKSDSGDYLIEWDNEKKLSTIVLADTRNTSTNVLNLQDGSFIDMKVIIDTDNDDAYLYWTDNINPPRQININRAKSYGENNFTEEDINVIVALPLNSPIIELYKTTTERENTLEQLFFRFATRYIYEDNRYSAMSPFSDLAFTPTDFNFDYASKSND